MARFKCPVCHRGIEINIGTSKESTSAYMRYLYNIVITIKSI